MTSDNTKISIGMPIFNGGKFLEKKLESLLGQTFSNFELIISDNASTDSTPTICKQYMKNDNRIRYFRQEKNMGNVWNFNFVLEQAKSEFFVWTNVASIMLPEFLEKNINVLSFKKNAVGTICMIKSFGKKEDKFVKINSFLKKLGIGFRPFSLYTISGKYEERINSYLEKMPWYYFYGVFRTEPLKKSIVREAMIGNDGACVLNVLRYGDIEAIDDVLLYGHAGGTQSKGMIHMVGLFDNGILAKVFPYYPLTKYCSKTLGKKNFLKNFHHFIRLNFDGVFLIMIDLLRLLNNKLK